MKHSRFSRRKTSEERKTLQQLIISLAGIISLLFLFFYIGIPFFIKLSGLIAGFKKDTTPSQSESGIILEPYIDPLPVATNSAKITVSGNGNSGDTIVLYVNKLKKEEKVIGKDGIFTFNNVTLDRGPNEIYATSKSGNKESQPSNKITIIYKNEPPKLELEAPKDGDVFKGDQKEIEIKGITDEQTTVLVNDRLVIVDGNGNFSTMFRLQDGENKLEIKATDIAGNIQKVDLKIIYEP